MTSGNLITAQNDTDLFKAEQLLKKHKIENHHICVEIHGGSNGDIESRLEKRNVNRPD